MMDKKCIICGGEFHTAVKSNHSCSDCGQIFHDVMDIVYKRSQKKHQYLPSWWNDKVDKLQKKLEV